MTERIARLTEALGLLRACEYGFVTPTPATHARVIARAGNRLAETLRDVFGWSLPFRAEAIDARLFDLLHGAQALNACGDGIWRSLVRVSSLGGDLLLHSAFPTTQGDSVFFGPDSYRFAHFLGQTLPDLGARRALVDVGAGAGVGAIAAARAATIPSVTMTDINPKALELAQANWAHAELETAQFALGDGLSGVAHPVDLVIANPPYIIDGARRAYRDGGGLHGAALSLDWARAAAERLGPNGALVLYTGSAIVGGEDRMQAALDAILDGFDVSYREIDPDVFGEELEREAYADVDRIAVVGVVAVKR